jgi:hypothetical protein
MRYSSDNYVERLMKLSSLPFGWERNQTGLSSSLLTIKAEKAPSSCLPDH